MDGKFYVLLGCMFAVFLVSVDGACTTRDLLSSIQACSPSFYAQAQPRLPKGESNVMGILQSLNTDDWTFFCNRINTSTFFDCVMSRIKLCTEESEKEQVDGYLQYAVLLVDGTCPKYMTTTTTSTPRTTIPEMRRTTTPGCRPGETKDEGRSGNWCYGSLCDDFGQWADWDNFNCGSTTTTTTVPTTTPSRGCRPGETKDEGRSGNWCYGSLCDNSGQWVEWDNFNCGSTTPTTTVPTTTPSRGCRPGETKDEGRSGNWCYGSHCDDFGQWVEWDNFNCGSTTPTTIPPTTATPTTATSSHTITTTSSKTPKQCVFRNNVIISRGMRVKTWQSGNNCSGVYCSDTGILLKWANSSCQLVCDKQYLGFVMDNCSPAPSVNKKIQRALNALGTASDLTTSLLAMMSALSKDDWDIICPKMELVKDCIEGEIKPCDLDESTAQGIDSAIRTIKSSICRARITTTTSSTRQRGNLISRGQQNIGHWLLPILTFLLALILYMENN